LPYAPEKSIPEVFSRVRWNSNKFFIQRFSTTDNREENLKHTILEGDRHYLSAGERNKPSHSGMDPESVGIDLSLLEDISPIGWENILFYGEYVLNRNLVK
jgi:hypothetical protein